MSRVPEDLLRILSQEQRTALPDIDPQKADGMKIGIAPGGIIAGIPVQKDKETKAWLTLQLMHYLGTPLGFVDDAEEAERTGEEPLGFDLVSFPSQAIPSPLKPYSGVMENQMEMAL